ncbi:MAG TPA: hypothetical protein VNR42_08470 [Solirubrobacteraceae bacterium]|nr:hypothetical protein [Solirubrobacteraceae bacterium]
MALHVDIIKTDPLATGEHRLARAVFENGVVIIDKANDPGYWLSTLTVATAIDPAIEPKGFFEALPTALDGTYVYATRPHQDADCPITHPAVDEAIGQ